MVRHSVAMLVGAGNESPAEVLTLDILSRRGKTIRPKTLNQKRYVDAIDANTIVFGIGPPAPEKPTWPWPRRSMRCRPSRSTASS
ncbi:phoH-like family protein [Mycobacterium ulcerans str. Harvey]|uniref:PhoH-like family protein n=1 Tax=Mycobacterium ulcerans str. Harvey TaxID=1299332 RepID=A0ABN0QSH9_MYCUL|nr:phoH-like family protein [Mycobacterium ulcerans str. Harvey]